jgi:hypothetical protein
VTGLPSCSWMSSVARLARWISIHFGWTRRIRADTGTVRLTRGGFTSEIP